MERERKFLTPCEGCPFEKEIENLKNKIKELEGQIESMKTVLTGIIMIILFEPDIRRRRKHEY